MKKGICSLSLLLLTLVNCSPVRNFNYHSAYKFKYIQVQSDQAETSPSKLIEAQVSDKSEYYEASQINSPFIPASGKLATPDHPITLPLTPVELKKSDSPLSGHEDNLFNSEKENYQKEVSKETKHVKRAQRKIKKRRRGSAFGDIHPRLKGFIWVVIGLGVVLVGVILIPVEVLSLIAIILGFGLVAFGFLKILGIL